MVADVPAVLVKPIPDVNADGPPGYYTNGTLFLNFYGDRDSLDLWFLKVLRDPRLSGVLLEVSTLDEFMTLDYLKKGMVDVAV